MSFSRHLFEPASDLTLSADLFSLLQPGVWAVEPRCMPPDPHRPERLLAGRPAGSVFAVSVTSATALAVQIGPIVISRVAAEACRVSELASLALHELVTNAAVHGNLGVPSGSSRTWQDLAGRQASIEAALSDPAKARLSVTVAVGWTPVEVTAFVVDEGAGYLVTEEGQGSAGGQGIRRAAGRGLDFARASGRISVTLGGRCARLDMPCQRKGMG